MRKVVVCALGLVLGACGDDETKGTDAHSHAPSRAEVVENYADIVHASYAESLLTAERLHAALETFVDDPTPATLEAAKRAWLNARVPYGQTEAYRFYAGPIDGEDGPEGRLNAWPLDEAYIDYVEGDDEAGIINDTSITISKETLSSYNEGAEGDILDVGEDFAADAAISTGYHAIEFLLWGQDNDDNGPGSRSHWDYTGDVDNHDRRGLYLLTVSEILVEDLEWLVDAWAPNSTTNFRAEFTADADAALAKMLRAIGTLSKSELAGERMDVALSTHSSEDEHSCFSDNTHVDIAMNALGVANVYYGRFGFIDGPGVDELVAEADKTLAATVAEQLDAALTAIGLMDPPFDQLIVNGNTAGNAQVDAAINALGDVGDSVVDVGVALGLSGVTTELPE